MGFRSRMAVTAVLAITLGVAGCGETDKNEPTGSESKASSQPTTPAQSSKPPAAQVSGAGLTTATFIPATKRAAATKTTVRTTMRMAVQGTTIVSSGVIRTGPNPAMSMTTTNPGTSGPIKMILVDRTFYLSIPGQVPAGKYRRYPANTTNVMVKNLRQNLEGQDPRKTFDALGAGLRKVTFVGSENSGGQRLHHYKVVVDTKKVLAAQGQQVPAGLPPTLTYDIWLDDQRLMRKVAFTMPGVTTLMVMGDYGKPVTITAPPRSAIVA